MPLQDAGEPVGVCATGGVGAYTFVRFGSAEIAMANWRYGCAMSRTVATWWPRLARNEREGTPLGKGSQPDMSLRYPFKPAPFTE